jgi:hypothetical protein
VFPSWVVVMMHSTMSSEVLAILSVVKSFAPLSSRILAPGANDSMIEGSGERLTC